MSEKSMNREGLMILCDYDTYANHLVLETIAKLNEDEFTGESSPSHHSVRKLILHALEAEKYFLSLCQERLFQELPDLHSVTDIRSHWAQVEHDIQGWIAAANEDDLKREVPFRLKGQSLQFPKWQLLMQAFFHCAQHRSELSVVLTQLGHPLPNLDIILHFIEQNKNESNNIGT